MDPLIKTQKQAIRIISCAKKQAHSLPLFIKLGLLDLRKMYLYYVQLFMFLFHRKLIPSIVDNLFIQNNHVHKYNTRHANHLHVSMIITKPLSRSVRVTGVKIYNYFKTLAETDVRMSLDVSYATYKTHLKKHIMDSIDIYSTL